MNNSMFAINNDLARSRYHVGGHQGGRSFAMDVGTFMVNGAVCTSRGVSIESDACSRHVQLAGGRGIDMFEDCGCCRSSSLVLTMDNGGT
jgi:hypothetical protein